MPLQSYLTCDNAENKTVLDEWLSGIFVVEGVQDRSFAAREAFSR